MSGVVEDLRDEVTRLSEVVERLCRKLGHEFTDGAYPTCKSNHGARVTDKDDRERSCDICGAFRCCETEPLREDSRVAGELMPALAGVRRKK